MNDTTLIPQAIIESTPTPQHPVAADEREVVSTHVLVEHDKVDLLRELSRRTRVAQSEYLREAVDDLLTKYHRLPEEP
jgi:hypothetical protein